MLYPSLHLEPNLAFQNFLTSVHTFLPAYVTDCKSRLVGKKPVAVQIQNTVKAAMQSSIIYMNPLLNFGSPLVKILARFVRMKNFNYVNQSIQEMLEISSQCGDFAEFNIDVCAIDWDDYIRSSVIGFQKYMMQCNSTELPAARNHLKRFVLMYTI